MTDEQLVATNEELVKRLRGMDGDSMSIKTLDEAADLIEALTEQLEQLVAINEAARADAKEAEAYAEELEKERDDYAFKLADANNTYSEMHVALNEANDKLVKAVEALRGLMQHMPDYADTVWQDARETLAEIENSEAVTLGEKG